MKLLSIFNAQKFTSSQILFCFGRVHQHPQSNKAWKEQNCRVKAEKSYRDYDGINEESTQFEWNIFPGFTTLHLCGKVTDLLSRLGETPETFTGRILFVSMFNDISCVTTKAMKMNVWQMPKSSPYLQ